MKISIRGDFYDCQIYRGRLYLWTFNGELKVYNWSKLVQSLIKEETDNIAMTFCFLNGNSLYRPSLISLFKDNDFKKTLLEKFKRIENLDMQLSEKDINKFLLGEQDTPTRILPTDTEIYSNKLYFIHEQGFFSGSAHRDKSSKYPVSSRPTKLWDCNLLSIKANTYPQLALSGGDEGLYELNMATSSSINLKRVESKYPIFQVSTKHSSFSNYSFLSIYNTSLVEGSHLSMFKWNLIKGNNNKKIYLRDFDTSISDKQIFATKGKQHFVSWGGEDKIYKATSKGFDIVRYNKYADENRGEEKFTSLESVNIHPWKGQIINGGTAYFGNIIECENALVILQSDNESLTIPGPITKWRIYPRSRNYENHLHVILDDRIEIYSFNHDYFLNQADKKIGLQFMEEKHSQTLRQSNVDGIAFP